MHKLIVFLLISVVMLQAGFAAAGSACLHEQDAGAHHFGHHAHEHRTTAAGLSTAGEHSSDPAKSAFPSGTASGDLDQDHDCTTCHANAPAGLPAWSRGPVLPEGIDLLAEASPFHLSPPPPARPERPNWFGTA